MLIVAGTLTAAPAMRGGLVKALGDASYSIYLLHPLLVGMTWRLLGWLPVSAFLTASLVLSSLMELARFTLLEKLVTVC